MATTTNFGWETPDDTDLVKDGALAMRTLGNSIDTSLVDLKGGTTGQVLSKASNTDMDFTWVTDAGDIAGVTAGVGITGGGTSGTVTITNDMATKIDAKGDLVVGTGADTYDRLAVGTNNHVLTADSAASTGVKWAAVPTASFKGCQLWKSNNQSINNATYTAITFDSENFDTDGFHSTVTNTSRITIPAGLGGKYLITFTAGYAASATGIRGSALYKNGSQTHIMFQVSASSAADHFFAGSQIMNLTAGDYVEIFLYQNSGGALDVKGLSDNATTFSCQYLGA